MNDPVSDTAAIAQQIRAADDRRLAAMEAGDADALDALMHPSFYYTHFSGRTEPKLPYVDRVRKGFAIYSDARRWDDNVHVYGSTAVHQGRVRMHIELPPQASSVDIDSAFTAVWVQQSGSWQIVAYASTGINPV